MTSSEIALLFVLVTLACFWAGYTILSSKKILVDGVVHFEFHRFKPGCTVVDSYEFAAKKTFLKPGEAARLDMGKWEPHDHEELEAALRIISQLDAEVLSSTGQHLIVENYVPYRFCCDSVSRHFQTEMSTLFRLEES